MPPSKSPQAKRTDAIEVYSPEALELRLAGATFRKIGEALGVSHTTARTWVKNSIAEYNKLKLKLAEELRAQEVMRCDRLILELWARSVGKVNGVHKADAAEERAAIEQIRKLMDQKAKYEGTYAPQKVAPTDADGNTLGNLSLDELGLRIQAITDGTEIIDAEFGEADTAAAGEADTPAQ